MCPLLMFAGGSFFLESATVNGKERQVDVRNRSVNGAGGWRIPLSIVVPWSCERTRENRLHSPPQSTHPSPHKVITLEIVIFYRYLVRFFGYYPNILSTYTIINFSLNWWNWINCFWSILLYIYINFFSMHWRNLTK